MCGLFRSRSLPGRSHIIQQSPRHRSMILPVSVTALAKRVQSLSLACWVWVHHQRLPSRRFVFHDRYGRSCSIRKNTNQTNGDKMICDEISKNIIRKFQWPRGGDCKYISKPSAYRIARDLDVHPNTVKLRLNEMFDSGLIRGVKFYADDAFMPWNRYFIMTRKTGNVPKVVYEHFRELPFV